MARYMLPTRPQSTSRLQQGGELRTLALVVFGLACGLHACYAAAQTPTPVVAPEQATDEALIVNVQSFRDPYRTPYRVVHKAMGLMSEMAALSPDATLNFFIVAKSGLPFPGRVQISIGEGDKRILIDADPDNTFVLPASAHAAGSGAELQVNARRKDVYLRPEVHSPGSQAGQRRLGDLRLECEITWRIEYEESSLFARAALGLMSSPCKSPKFGVEFYPRHKLAMATISENGRVKNLNLAKGGHAYYAPLADASWSDAASITLIAAPPDGAK